MCLTTTKIIDCVLIVMCSLLDLLIASAATGDFNSIVTIVMIKL